MVFLIILAIALFIAGCVIACWQYEESWCFVGILAAVIIPLLILVGAAVKDCSSKTNQIYQLNSTVPYVTNKSEYCFYVINTENNEVQPINIDKSKVNVVFSQDKEYEVNITTGHYDKTAFWGSLMPDLYGERDSKLEAILYLPVPKK